MALRLALIMLAAWALRRELTGVQIGELLRHLRAYGWRHATLALGATVASFLTLGGIETLALRYAARDMRVPRRAAMTTGFVAHAISQSVGFALLTGAAVRLRAYARYRLDTSAIARTSGFVTLTVTLGLLACGAGALLASAQPLILGGRRIHTLLLGISLALVVVAYLAWSALATGDTIGRGRWQLRRPSGRAALGQLLLSASDWLLTGAVLLALLPVGTGLGFGAMMRAYLLAQTAGMASHVPGGVGVFEAVMITLLAPGDATQRISIVAALVMFRVVYYLLPLVAAVAVGAVTELLPSRMRRVRSVAPIDGGVQVHHAG